MQRKKNKILPILALTFCVLVASIVFVSQTNTFKKWLGEQLIVNLEKIIDGKITIQKISGNLISNIQITGLQVITSQDTILCLHELDIKFKLVDLLYKKLTFHAVSIDSPKVKLLKNADGIWNYTALIKKDDKKNQDIESKKNGFTLNIAFDRISIHDGYLQMVTGPDSQQAFRVKNINMLTGLSYKNGRLTISLKELALKNINPLFSLNKGQCNLTLADNLLDIQNMLFESDSSHINGDGSFNIKTRQLNQTHLKINPVHIAEVKKFIPGLPMSGTGIVNLDAFTKNDTLIFQLLVKKESGEIAIDGSASNLADQPFYKMDIDANSLNLTEWLDNIRIPIHLAGYINIQGSGKDLDHLKTTIKANLQYCTVNEVLITGIALTAKLKDRTIHTKFQAFQDSSHIALDGKLRLDQSMPYSLTTQIYHLNLGKIATNFPTNLNGTIRAAGAFSNTDNLISLNGQFGPSSLLNFSLDTLFTTLSYRNKLIKVDTLYLQSDPGELSMNGMGSIDSLYTINFLYKVGNIGKFYPEHVLQTDGTIAGTFTGSVDSFYVNARFDLDSLKMDAHSAETIKGIGQVHYSQDNFYGSVSMSMYNNIFSGLKTDSLYIRADYADHKLTNAISVAVNDTISGYINSYLLLNDLRGLHINELDFNIGKMHWSGVHYPIILEAKDNEFKINNFNIQSQGQGIAVDGELGHKGDEQLQVTVKDLNLTSLSNFIMPGSPVTGILNIKSNLTGSMNDPVFTMQLNITDVKYNTFSIENAEADFSYRNNILQFNSSLNQNATEKLFITGAFPVNLNAKNRQDIILRDKPVELTIVSDGIDISLLDILTNNTTRTVGKASLNIKITETLAHPDIFGSLAINKASFAVPRYGSNFNNIRLQVQLDNNKITINDLFAQNDKGQLLVNGYLGLSDKFNKWEETSLSLNVSNYPIARSQNLELTINSKIQFNGKPGNFVFDGVTDIQRAKIYLPAFLSMSEPTQAQSLSILENAEALQEKTSVSEKPKSSFFQNLRGKTKINVTRNAWLRNDDINLEVAGALDIIKDSPEMKLFGTMQTVRGTIEVYGKRFKISEGQITFTGNNQLGPEVNILALHEFRDVYGDKKQLLLKISGNLDRPVISFLLNEIQIEEKDAVSYLLFSRNSDDLSFGEKSQLGQNQGLVSASGVEQILTSRLSGEITSQLQKRLNLDMIEFKGESNRGQASLMLGKYITNDFFLGYKREFNLGGAHEIAADEISLEYEINKFLFLQATKGDDKTTGFDLFWKFEK